MLQDSSRDGPTTPAGPSSPIGGRVCPPSAPPPDFGAAVLEELEELGDHDVEGPVEGVTVQELGGILTNLLQGPECPLRTPGRGGGVSAGCVPSTSPPEPPWTPPSTSQVL